jgi:hypothetical protein
MSDTFDEVKEKLNLTPLQLATLAAAKALLANQKKIKVLYAYEKIQGEGYGHYYCLDTKLYVKIRKGRLINRLTENTDSKGRYVVFTEDQKILVPSEEIVDIGFN